MPPRILHIARGAALALCAVTAIEATGAATANAAAPVYKIESLEKNHHARPQSALGISTNGIVTGRAWIRSRYSASAYRYENGAVRPLPAPDIWDAAGWRVNRRGTVAGWVGQEAWTWDEAGAATNLGAMVPCDAGSDRSSTARGINDANDVVFNFICDRAGARVFGAYLYRGGTLVEIGTLGGDYTAAGGINNLGQIAGSPFLAPGGDGRVQEHAFIWEDGKMRDIGTLGGDSAGAQGINDAGHVIGLSTNAANENRGYWYDGTTMHQLPACDGRNNWPQPSALNNHDQITGNFFRDGFEAFLYQKGRCYPLLKLLDASGAGWTRLQASDINDHGVIVGTGVLDGKSRPFIATPVEP